MWRRDPIFCIPISGRHSNGKTLGELQNSKVGYFWTGLVWHLCYSAEIWPSTSFYIFQEYPTRSLPGACWSVWTPLKRPSVKFFYSLGTPLPVSIHTYLHFVVDGTQFNISIRRQLWTALCWIEKLSGKVLLMSGLGVLWIWMLWGCSCSLGDAGINAWLWPSVKSIDSVTFEV